MFDSDYSRIIEDTDSSIISYINRNQELKNSIGINALSKNITDNKTRLIAQRKLENLIEEAKLKKEQLIIFGSDYSRIIEHTDSSIISYSTKEIRKSY